MGVAVEESTAPPVAVPVVPSPRKWRRSLDGAGLLVLVVIVVVVFGFIHHFAVNMIYYDQWADISVIRHAHDGTLSFATLWAQHNENRILFPNLVVLALAATTHFNVVVEDYLSGILLVGATALLIVTHRRRSPTLSWLVYCPVALVALSFAPLGTVLFGFLISWYLVMLGLAVALYLLDRPNLTRLVLAGAVVAAVVGSFSSLQGLFIWPAGLVLLYLRRRGRRALIAWVGCAAVTVVLYFVNFNFSATGGDESSVLAHPWLALRFFFESLGNVTGSPIATATGTVDTGALVLGVVVFAIAVVAVVHGVRYGRENGGALGVALIAYGLVFVAFTTVGRTQLGLNAEGRFATFDLFVWVGAYLALLGPVPWPIRQRIRRWSTGDRTTEPSPLPRGTAVAAVAMAVLVCLMAAQVVLGYSNGRANARGWAYEESEVADITANIDHTPDGLVQGVLGNYPASYLRGLAAFARSQHLSLFDTPLATEDADKGLFPELLTTVVYPKDGALLTGRTYLDATTAANQGIARVQFRATGPGTGSRVVATARLFTYGWLALWDTTGVADGTYRLRSEIVYRDGKTVASKPIFVFVVNGLRHPSGG
jgi:hypothetical protein